MRIRTQIRLWIRIRRPNYYGSGLMSFKWIRIHNTATFLYLKPYKSVQSGSAVITNQWIGTALLGTAWIMTKLNWFISCCFSCSLPRLGFSKYRYRYRYGARAFMCPDNINAEETDPSWICNNKRQVNSNFCCNKNLVFYQNILSASYFGYGFQEFRTGFIGIP